MKREPIPPAYWEAYAARVAELEAQGMTTSDAQGVADVELPLPGSPFAQRAGTQEPGK